MVVICKSAYADNAWYMGESITQIFDKFVGVLSSFDSVGDFLDIILVATLFYALFMQIRKTQSIQIIRGIILIAVIYAVVVIFKMETSLFLFDQLITNILLILVIIFNTEIRQALERAGESSFKKINLFKETPSDEIISETVNATCKACMAMSAENVGSLMIFQRTTLLGDLTKGSVPIDSVTSTEMLLSIFYPNSSLHDGAIVIDKGRIIAARCIVPLKNDREVTENVGTRHRAALEISRTSDAVAVVTSEETGIISIAVEGELIRGIGEDELKEKLTALLKNSEDTGVNKKAGFNPFKKWQRRDKE